MNISREHLYKLYINEYRTIKDISQILGVSTITVMSRLKKFQIPTRVRSDYDIDSYSRDNKKIKFNQSCFSYLNEDTLYWAGFIAADGCISNKDTTINISLQERDVGHLNKFKEFIQYTGDLQYNPLLKSYSITIYSKKICSDLKNNFNITMRKSATFTPNSHSIVSIDFWRGMFDGDGSIYAINKPIISLVGNNKSVELFKNWCTNYIESTAKIRKHTTADAYYYTIGHKKARRILEIIYGNNPKYYLDRKYNLYKELPGVR